MNLILMLGLNETIGQLAMANSVCSYVRVLRREDNHALRKSFELEVKSQRKKVGGIRSHEVRFEQGRFTLPIKVDFSG